MTTIAGVRIHPGYFKKAPIREGPRVGATVGNFRLKKTLTRAPAPLRALYAMPVIAVVAAIGSIAVAVPVVAAAVAAGTIGFAAIAAGVTILGGVLTIAGAITGNENLIKYGGIISLVGGVGTIAAGAFGAGAGAAGADVAADGINAGIDSAAMDSTAGMAGAANAPAAAAPATGTATLVPTTGPPTLGGNPVNPSMPPGPLTDPSLPATQTPTASNINGFATNTPTQISDTTSTLRTAGTAGPAQPGMLDSMGSFMTDSRFKPLWEMASKIPTAQQRAQTAGIEANTDYTRLQEEIMRRRANRWNPPGT